MEGSRQTDEQVAASVQAGNAQLFGLLVERYEARMARYAKRFLFGYHDAEDLVQEVFLKAYVNIQSFDSGRPFTSWLYRIAHNVFINAIKRRGREPLPFFDPDTVFPHPVAKDSPERDFEEWEIKDALGRCLDRLDPKYREPLVLYHFEEMDYRAISEIMRIPVSTVGVRLSRAKALLKGAYESLTQHHG